MSLQVGPRGAATSSGCDATRRGEIVEPLEMAGEQRGVRQPATSPSQQAVLGPIEPLIGARAFGIPRAEASRDGRLDGAHAPLPADILSSTAQLGAPPKTPSQRQLAHLCVNLIPPAGVSTPTAGEGDLPIWRNRPTSVRRAVDRLGGGPDVGRCSSADCESPTAKSRSNPLHWRALLGPAAAYGDPTLINALIARRSSIAAYASATPSSPVSKSKTSPGSMLPSRTSFKSSGM